jgi:hypothetical protein
MSLLHLELGRRFRAVKKGAARMNLNVKIMRCEMHVDAYVSVPGF